MANLVRLTYCPDGGSKREWTLDFENPAWDLAYQTEKATGWPWEEFGEKLAHGSHIALRALIFTLRRRDEPRLQLESVTPTLAEIDLETVGRDDDDDATGDNTGDESGEA